MRGGKRDARVGRSLFSLRGYLLFFLLVSFLVSCCFVLFLDTLQAQLGTRFSREELQQAAKITFVNVAFLSLLCTLLDGLRRKLTVERPVRRILHAAHRLTQGDFSARIQPLHGFDSMNELDVIIEDFNKMAGELASIETLRSDFIANVSHELKTPLAAMQNYATLLQAPDLSPEQRAEYAGAITAATRRLSRLVTDILKLNRLEHQEIFPQWSSYDLSEQLCQCLLSFEAGWEEKGLVIEADLDRPVTVRGDADLLALVWSNLISNAVKFTPPGGTVAVAAAVRGDAVVVTVRDTGCGMSPEVGRHIFEQFYQGDSAHAAQGNGLGLALVKRVMDIMGGNITVESRPGAGSTFTVTLPGGMP